VLVVQVPARAHHELLVVLGADHHPALAVEHLAHAGSILPKMADWIQVCGPLVMRLDGDRAEGRLPGRQGRQVVAYLLVQRARSVPRDELVEALWWRETPDGAQGTLSTLLSRARRVLGERLQGRSDVRLVLAGDAWVDLEVADRAVHVAESAVAQGQWDRAWAPARTALHVANRGFLPGFDAPWIEERRRHVENIRVRALEAVATSGLALGGTELQSAERSARTLIEISPFRESGYRHLMEYFAARDDVAEALQVYERLRTLLREELGVAPSPTAQELHRRLLGR
jgi:SARP family transcriptional regulator, regulator of embCAB operon